MIHVGVIGSGFIAKGFYKSTMRRGDMCVDKVLTRSNIANRTDWPSGILTNDIDEVAKHVDVVLECSGDTAYATDCLSYIATHHPKPVVTMNSEFHITTGQYFYGKIPVIEAEGDQSGCMVAFAQELKDMGFRPLVYGNHKRYLKTNVSRKQALYWSKKNKVSLDKTIAFTDGSKAEIENIFIANSMDAYFYDGPVEGDKIDFLAKTSQRTLKKYVDYFVNKKAPSGIFIVTDHRQEQNDYLRYLKFPINYQILERPYHFCHMEIPKTICKVMANPKTLYPTSYFNRYMAASLTKKPIKAGDKIDIGLGGLEIRGIHHEFNRSLVPITVLNNATATKDLPEGRLIGFDDVDLHPSLAIDIWRGYAV